MEVRRVVINNLEQYKKPLDELLEIYDIYDVNYLHNIYEVAIDLSLVDIKDTSFLYNKINEFLMDTNLLEISDIDVEFLIKHITTISTYIRSKIMNLNYNNLYIEKIDDNFIILNLKED